MQEKLTRERDAARPLAVLDRLERGLRAFEPQIRKAAAAVEHIEAVARRFAARVQRVQPCRARARAPRCVVRRHAIPRAPTRASPESGSPQLVQPSEVRVPWSPIRSK